MDSLYLKLLYMEKSDIITLIQVTRLMDRGMGHSLNPEMITDNLFRLSEHDAQKNNHSIMYYHIV